MYSNSRSDMNEETRALKEESVEDVIVTDLFSLQASEIQYRRLFETAKDGILILDAESGMIVDVNPFLINLLGYSRENFVGKAIWELGSFRDVVSNKSKFEELRSKEYIRYEDMPLESSDGRQIEVEFVSNVYTVNDQKVIQCNIRDISERKRVEKELKQYRENLEELVKDRTNELLRTQKQLLQSQKMEAIGTVAGGMAHDFNNMLTVIMGNAEMAIKKAESDSLVRSELMNIFKASTRAKDLTMHILTLSRHETLEVKPMDFNMILRDIFAIISKAYPKNIIIKIEPSQGILPIMADANQILQVMLNICNNARDAMPKGGILRVESKMKPVTNLFCEDDPDLKQGIYCVVSISDTGSGMTDTVKKRIYEPFFTTKDANTGTGLGLYISNGIVQSHGGRIFVSSEFGEGTEMTMYLPAATEAEIMDMDDVPDEAFSEVKTGNETILFVDDESMIRELAMDILSVAGYESIPACSGKEAIAIYTERGKEIDLVILDMIMPDMDGVTVYHSLKEINPDVRIIISSGLTRESIADEIFESGYIKFVQKPFLFNDFCDAIEGALDLINHSAGV